MGGQRNYREGTFGIYGDMPYVYKDVAYEMRAVWWVTVRCCGKPMAGDFVVVSDKC